MNTEYTEEDGGESGFLCVPLCTLWFTILVRLPRPSLGKNDVNEIDLLPSSE